MNEHSMHTTAPTAFGANGAFAQPSAIGEGPSVETAMHIIADWPTNAQHSATVLLTNYGAPAEATPSQLTWFNNGPWKRTIVQKEEIEHIFPMPHKDVMQQVVDYVVPEDKLDQIAHFDGSVSVDRTRGEMAARCDNEAANFLALNMADEVANGKRSVEDARAFYPKAIMAHLEKKPTPYTLKLMFSAKGGTANPDKTTMSKDTIQKAMELKKAMIAEENEKARVSLKNGG